MLNAHAQSRPTLCASRDCSLPGSSVHGILQARILEWVSISSFRETSWPRNWIHVFCLGRRILYHWDTWKAQENAMGMNNPDSLLYEALSPGIICPGLCCSFRRRRWHPSPVLLPGKSYGRRSLVGCSPWGSDTTERHHFHFSLSCIGEGNGNPLQCSCLENPRDSRAW